MRRKNFAMEFTDFFEYDRPINEEELAMRLRNIPEAMPAIEASPYCFIDPREYRGAWKAFFGNDNPIYIEIGMGKGQFIMEHARRNPDINYLGIEKYASVLYRGLQKFEEEENPLPNLRFLCVNAEKLNEFFAEGEVDRIYLNFSDPWPKDRHAKRRLTSSTYLSLYKDILSRDGQIEFKTDNRGLFDFSVEEINQSIDFVITDITYDLHHDEAMNAGNIMTEYEVKFSSKGNPIHKLIAKHRL